MRALFLLMQVAKALRSSWVLSVIVLVGVVTSVNWWTYAINEWQDRRDGFFYYVSQAARDETTADIDAQVQAIIHQCGIRIEFQAEKTDKDYRERKLGECQARIASYRRVNVKERGDRVVVTAKVKCRCGSDG